MQKYSPCAPQSWDLVSTSECRGPGKLLALHGNNRVDKLKFWYVLPQVHVIQLSIYMHQSKERGARWKGDSIESASSLWDSGMGCGGEGHAAKFTGLKTLILYGLKLSFKMCIPLKCSNISGETTNLNPSGSR